MVMIEAFASMPQRDEIERRTQLEYHFVESDAQRCAHLQGLVTAARHTLPASWPAPSVLRADYGHAVRPIVERLGAEEVPTFLFVDPFGYLDPPPDLTSRLLNFWRCETLTFVPTNYIIRFASQPAMETPLDNFFGGPGWRRARGLAARPAAAVILEELTARLREDARWVRTFEFTTSESQLYHLFFATNNDRGYQKMKEAMWAVDPAGGSRFSDMTSPGQEVMFSDSSDLGLLERQLRARFAANSWHRYASLLEFTWYDTAYLPKHLNDDLERLEARGLLQAIQRGPRRGWRPESLVNFLP
jgi:three-Cys-motif partner protein